MTSATSHTDKIHNQEQRTDCVVIGAGPAGISAAKWLHSFDIPFRWVSPNGRIGGLLHRVNNRIVNYPGGAYDSGRSLVEAFKADLQDFELCPESGHVRRLRRDELSWRLDFLERSALLAETVILATGTRYRTLDIPGESEGLGTCVSQSATGDGARFANKSVAVVGGGDAGFENALRLADHGCKVWMLLRNDQFKARPAFVDGARQNPRIEFYPCPTVVTEIQPHAGDDEGCRLLLDVDGDEQTLDVACLFVRIGVEPVLPDIQPPARTHDGFVIVDADQATSLDGVFAAGDITDCLLRSIATAVGSGATAAKAVAQHLGRLG